MEYYQLREKNYILTDEYLNNLASFTDTVYNFYQSGGGYQVRNPEGQAIVYLMPA